MYILDTDHLSVIDRKGVNAERLLQKLANIDPTQVATTIISYEEQMRGWLSYTAKAQSIDKQIKAYKELKRQLTNYCIIPIVEFDEQAAYELQRLKKMYPRLGTMDLKIASIVLVNKAILLTRNNLDFGLITGLSIENWTC